MSEIIQMQFNDFEAKAVWAWDGKIAVLASKGGALGEQAKAVDERSGGAVSRAVGSAAFKDAKSGDVVMINFPDGLAATGIAVVKTGKKAAAARKAGAKLAMHALKADVLVLAEDDPNDAKALEAAAAPLLAIAEGVHFTRDLTNEPANILTSSVVVMSWNGGGKEAPLALVGKGVVFDTGGISMKPAGGMEAMTMDMGGAGVVAGVMKSLALRGAKANVIGVVGLVENMPDGRAQRPGDVVTSMKGDTIEVINTDAEGRLVLCDALWYVQEQYKPSGIIDLATLTGAAIIALGHENAAVFSNSSKFASKFLKSAKKEGEGAWQLPLGDGYDAQLKSRIADMKNVGGRPAGSITAAQFLARFIKKDMDWIHLDIAGVASLSKDTELAPKGATGWGVRALNRMISDYYE